MILFRLTVKSFVLLALGPSLACAQGKPLVSRDRIQLNLAGAEAVLEAARAKAAAMGLKVNIAVVDDGVTSRSPGWTGPGRPAATRP